MYSHKSARINYSATPTRNSFQDSRTIYYVACRRKMALLNSRAMIEITSSYATTFYFLSIHYGSITLPTICNASRIWLTLATTLISWCCQVIPNPVLLIHIGTLEYCIYSMSTFLIYDRAEQTRRKLWWKYCLLDGLIQYGGTGQGSRQLVFRKLLLYPKRTTLLSVLLILH